MKRFGVTLLVILLAACATSGPVSTVQSDSNQPVVAQPSPFLPALRDLDLSRQRISDLDDSLEFSTPLKSPAWQEYLGWLQVYDTAQAEQKAIEDEIENTGELVLEPGKSYSFDLQSYCVHAGAARPVTGDELRMGPLKGPSEKWISDILRLQGEKKIPQERIQYLIWTLLSDIRFDELFIDEQNILKQFYPDAAIRFGNRRMESLSSQVLGNLMPDSTSSFLSQISNLREHVLELRNNYTQLEKELAPISGRTMPIPVGWLKMDEGYLLRATSNSFTQIHIDIFVPETLCRMPSSVKPLVFRPWQWIGLPAQGQRLAVSTRVIRKPVLKVANDPCKKA